MTLLQFHDRADFDGAHQRVRDLDRHFDGFIQVFAIQNFNLVVDTFFLANPDRHLLVIDAKMMRNFVQDSVAYLFAHAVGVAVAIRFNRALVNGDDLGL